MSASAETCYFQFFFVNFSIEVPCGIESWLPVMLYAFPYRTKVTEL